MWDDLRIGLRTSLRNPGFTTLAVVTLALGIAANTAIFSVVHGVLLRPLPYAEPDRLVAVWMATPTDAKSNHSAGDFVDIVRDNTVFEAIGGYRPDLFAVTDDRGQALQFEGAIVTAPFFDVFGVPAASGRTFSDVVDGRTGGGKIVLGRQAATQIFGSRPAVGETLRVNSLSHLVVGVMPDGFEWPDGAALWTLSGKDVPPAPIDNAANDREVSYFNAVARLRADAGEAEIEADLARLSAEINERRAPSSERKSVTVVPLYDEVVGDVRGAIVILQIGVGIVLLIACANISGLLIARTTGRTREMAVRAAMGARSGRLIRQLLAESLILGMAGGLLGLLLGSWFVAFLVRFLPANLPRMETIALDREVAIVTLGISVVASVLFGALPALQGARANAAYAIRAGASRGHTGSRSTSRSALVVAEVALTIVLLVTAALLGTSLVQLQQVDPGFRADEVTLASIAIPQSRYPTGADQTAFYARLLETLGARGEFEAVAIGFPGPLRGQNARGSFFIEGREPVTGVDRPTANLGAVSAGYFDAMGITLLEGRVLGDSDTAESPEVAVVSATLARRYWPGESAVGKRFRFDNSEGQPWTTIVGVTADVRQLGLAEPPPAIIYFPYAVFTLPFTNVTVRSGAPQEVVTTALRASMSAVDPELPLADLTTLPALVSRSMADARFRTFVFGVLAAVALVLAAVGLYGIISYSVAERTREIGIRVALGAAPRQVVWPMVRWGLTLAGLGAFIGLVGSWLAARALGRFLFGVSATDPLTFLGVTAVLAVVAAVASYLPSRRALRINPLIALRE